MSPARYAVVLGAFALQRAVELGYSLRNEARLRKLEAKAPQAAPGSFKWMVPLHIGLFTLPLLECWRDAPTRRVSPVAQALGWGGALTAVGLRLWVIATLREQWTVRAVVPESLRVVDGGPYRWVRHPNYAAVVLEFAALPILGGAYRSATCLSLLNGIVLWDRIRDEETLLNAHPDYRSRMASKPRFVPRWRDIRSTDRQAGQPTRVG